MSDLPNRFMSSVPKPAASGSIPQPPVSPASDSPSSFSPELLAAFGRFDFPMTNDYMFRAVLQSSNKALKGLISSLLHIPPRHIHSVEITNPIILGDACTDKEFRLDINVALNNLSLINLEMQMVCRNSWHDRSLIYLCRSFDQLSRGEDYDEIKPVTHIGILDEAPPSEGEEFYARHLFMNVKTHKIYSDKLSLHVLNLRQIKYASKEDKDWGIDRWAALFKAATWERLKMIAQDNEYLTEASNTIFKMNADDLARKRCLDREEYYRDIRTYKRDLARMRATVEEQRIALAEKETALAEKETALAEKNALIENLRAQLANKQ